MTSILFHVNMHYRFFPMFKLVNRVISDHLVHKDLKNRTFYPIIHMLVNFIMCLILLDRTHGFPMFTKPCITFAFCINAECEFLDSRKHFAVLVVV